MEDILKLNLAEKIAFSDSEVNRQILLDSPQMRVALICVDKGQIMEPHSAPFDLVMYCVSGKGVFIVGEEEITVQSKEAVPCNAGIPHGFRAPKDEQLVVMAVVAKCGG